MSATIVHDPFTGPLGAQLQERFIAVALQDRMVLGVDAERRPTRRRWPTRGGCGR